MFFSFLFLSHRVDTVKVGLKSKPRTFKFIVKWAFGTHIVIERATSDDDS